MFGEVDFYLGVGKLALCLQRKLLKLPPREPPNTVRSNRRKTSNRMNQEGDLLILK